MFAILQVALTNLLLSSDNVLMIALLSHGVRGGSRRQALILSLLASLALQLAILALMAHLFHVPYLRSGFGLVIGYMALHLVRTHGPHSGTAARHGVPTAVVRITTGNLMMSFENEIALVALAKGNVWLAWTGVLVTSPLVFFGSHLLVELLRRYAVIVYAAAVYLFYIGAGLVLAVPWLRADAATGTWVLTALFAAYAAARYLERARSAARPGGAG